MQRTIQKYHVSRERIAALLRDPQFVEAVLVKRRGKSGGRIADKYASYLDVPWDRDREWVFELNCIQEIVRLEGKIVFAKGGLGRGRRRQGPDQERK